MLDHGRAPSPFSQPRSLSNPAGVPTERQLRIQPIMLERVIIDEEIAQVGELREADFWSRYDRGF